MLECDLQWNERWRFPAIVRDVKLLSFNMDLDFDESNMGCGCGAQWVSISILVVRE
jgi:hypothetical protein